MKSKRLFSLLVISFVVCMSARAQTAADGVIAGYFDAIGGRDKIAQINSMYVEGTMEVMGNSSPSKITVLNGKGYKSEMNFGGQDIVQAITDRGGWMINPFMGSPEPAPMPDDQYIPVKDEIFVGGPLVNYSINGYKVSLEGLDAVDGKPAYKIIAVSPDSIKTTFYIDSATHLMDEKVVEAGGQVTTAKYSNYQKTSFGNLMPYTEEITLPRGYVDQLYSNKGGSE